MRKRFDEQLVELNAALIQMGALVEDAIRQVTSALKTRDAGAARRLIENDAVVDSKEKEIERLCLNLILSQQPVASDLRTISAALKMITDMERIGDHAQDISELCVYIAELDFEPGEMPEISRMAAITSAMVTESIDAYVRRDLELARAVIARDDEVDALFVKIRRGLIALVHGSPERGELAFDLMQIAKYYERIGDHAVNIAEWVEFAITGVHKESRIL